MIFYYGVQHFRKNKGCYGQPVACSCGHTYPREIIRDSKWGHFDYIPLIPMGTDYYSVCPVCMNGFKADKEQKKEIKQLEELGFGSMPVCMAKTQYSFSDDAALLGAPRNFRITVRQVKVSAGAGFVVALTGNVMTMPGLGKAPAAFKIDVDETGKISGLF